MKIICSPCRTPYWAKESSIWKYRVVENQQGEGLTDWPSEALFVSADYFPHTSALCFQEPIRPSWKNHHQERNQAPGKPSLRKILIIGSTGTENLLLVPPAVMNKVFDLFILDVYFNTLQRET